MVRAYNRIVTYFVKFKALGVRRFLKTVRHKLLSRSLNAEPLTNAQRSFYRTSQTQWHCDPQFHTVGDHDYCFDPRRSYRDITINVSRTKQRVPDIRNVWELGRFHTAPFMDLAVLKKETTSFLDHNPFLYGPHWFNGMEVGIRSINWIIALQVHEKKLEKKGAWYQRLQSSLYDHMRYLEHNWEWYDGRTNNHYLANLVGYSYQLYFLSSVPNRIKKWRWCYEQLQQELSWQIFDEGTSYEGSTRYHQLVTELFLHGFVIAQQMGEIILPNVVEKLERMLLFIDRCTPENSDTVMIGDDDSGRVTHYFSIGQLANKMKLKREDVVGVFHYPKFGISIAAQYGWHVTLRHAAYENRQPTAHFHQDTGSVTIAYNGIPIIVDPGSYLYSGSRYLRNYFRSYQSHSTVYAPQRDLPHDLFSLDCMPSTIDCASEKNYLKTYFDVGPGVISRTVTVEQTGVRIVDQYRGNQALLNWSFILHPAIQLVENGDRWILRLPSGQRLILKSSSILKKRAAYFAERYGMLCTTSSLNLQRQTHLHQNSYLFDFSLEQADSL